jgi:hypothetical protein
MKAIARSNATYRQPTNIASITNNTVRAGKPIEFQRPAGVISMEKNLREKPG